MKLVLTLLLTIVIFCCHGQTKKAVLKFSFADGLAVPKQIKITLSPVGKRDNLTSLISATENGYVFEKQIEEPMYATINLKWSGEEQLNFNFLLPIDSGSIFIDADKTVNIEFYNDGKKLFHDFAKMQSNLDSIKLLSQHKIKTVNFENRSIDKVEREIDSIQVYYENYIDQYIYKKTFDNDKTSIVGVLALINYAERPASYQRRKFQRDSLLKIYDSFSNEMKKLPTMQAFHQLLISEKQLDIGMEFPILHARDTSNIPYELTKYYGEKYTLIDIWANWCTPCRSEHPGLINQYKKYKERGLNIISVSIDKISDTDLWKEAIKKDKVNIWPHFIDSEEEIYKNLKIRYIPANFLIDSNGKIIAKYLRGVDLEQKLKEIFNE